MLDAESAEISIHSLVKRETRDCYLIHGFFIDFNPLPRKEGDCLVQHIRTPLLISIHSLVKRETFRSPFLPRRRLYFNPLPRKEGDTSTVGCRAAETNFNPLPRKEGDAATTTAPKFPDVISIHSLVKRETERLETYSGKLVISIHSLVKRETTTPCRWLTLPAVFQSTPS